MAPPRLSRSAEARIRELREVYGITPTFEEVVWLHELGKQVENPAGAYPLHLIGLPVRVGNVTLWYWTIGASIWWVECGSRWFTKRQGVYALAWCLAHARTPEAILAATDRTAALERIETWIRGIGCTIEELTWGVERVVSADESQPHWERPENGDAELSSTEWDGFVATLTREIGADPRYWTWEASSTGALAMVRRMVAYNKARGEAPDASDPLVLAVHAEQQAMNAIIKAHQEEKAGS